MKPLALRTLTLATCVFIAGIASAANPPGFQELAIGDAAPDFKLPGIDGRDWSLGDFDQQILVVYFTSNHCPVCHAHDPRFVALLEELASERAEQRLAVVAINPNSGDGLRPAELGYSKYDDSFEAVSYTHLTLPTICSV